MADKLLATCDVCGKTAQTNDRGQRPHGWYRLSGDRFIFLDWIKDLCSVDCLRTYARAGAPMKPAPPNIGRNGRVLPPPPPPDYDAPFSSIGNDNKHKF